MSIFDMLRKKTEFGPLIKKLSDSPSVASTRAAGASNANIQAQEINQEALKALIDKAKEKIQNSTHYSSMQDTENNIIKTVLWHLCSKEEYAKLEQIGWDKILPSPAVEAPSVKPDVDDPYAAIRNMKETSPEDQALLKVYNEFKNNWGTDMLFAEDKTLVKFQQALGVFAEFKDKILDNLVLQQQFKNDYSVDMTGIKEIERLVDIKKGAPATRKDLKDFQLYVEANSSKTSAHKNR